MPAGGTSGIDGPAMPLLLLGLLAIFLIAPSAPYHEFTGLPLDSLPQYLGLLALLPIVAWPWLRRRWCATAARLPAGWLALAAAVLAAGTLLKGALFEEGGHDGFAGCYHALYRHEDNIRPRPDDRRAGPCEKAWENPLARFHATRIDPELDFGPRDWNLSFVNHRRFNFYDWRGGSLPRDRLPFSAYWRGAISSPEPRDATLTYVGRVQVWLGAEAFTFPSSQGAPRTAGMRLPAGDYSLVIAYTFDDGYRVGLPERGGAAFRLTTSTASGERPLRTRPAPAVWRLAGRTVDALAAAAAVVLASFWLSVTGMRWRVFLATAVAAAIVYAAGGEWELMGIDAPMTLALLLPGFMVVSRRGQPSALAAAYWCVAALMLAHEAAVAGALDAVLIRRGGSDYLTYESFARAILDTGSLAGGEDVFHYQPFFRYVLFVERLLLGDGDLLLPAFVRTALVMAVLFAAWTFRAGESRLDAALSLSAGALMLALVNTEEIVSAVRQSLSEYPTWIGFLLCFSLFFRPRGGGTTTGALLLGVSLITRINQAPGLLWLLGSRAWIALRAGQRGFLVAVGVFGALAALPAVHNYVYGERLVWTTTSATISQNLRIPPARYLDLRSDEALRAQVVEHLEGILYSGAEADRGDRLRPWPVYRGLQVLWLTAAIVLFVRRRGSRPRERVDLATVMTLASPVVFLAPHLFWQVDVYYPRHIVIGYLAMGAAALYASCAGCRGGSMGGGTVVKR